MNKSIRTFVLIITPLLVILAGCIAGCTTEPNTTYLGPTAAVAEPNTTSKQGDVNEAFQAILDRAEPFFTDKFENKIQTQDTISSDFYQQNVALARDVSYVEGVEGNGVHLDTLSSYVGYPAGLINSTEGTIRFFFMPDANLYDIYTERQSEWKDSDNISPPFVGFLIDTVGWNSAFSGGYSASLQFKQGDMNYSNFVFGTWSGSNWSNAAGEMPDQFIWENGKWYDIVLSYSKSQGKIKVYVNTKMIAEANYNTGLSTSEGFFLGQAPWKKGMEYWPYGAHAMMGTYSFLRLYDKALMD